MFGKETLVRDKQLFRIHFLFLFFFPRVMFDRLRKKNRNRQNVGNTLMMTSRLEITALTSSTESWWLESVRSGCIKTQMKNIVIRYLRIFEEWGKYSTANMASLSRYVPSVGVFIFDALERCLSDKSWGCWFREKNISKHWMKHFKI